MKKLLAPFIILFLCTCVYSQRLSVGSVIHDNVYTFKVQGLTNGNRYLCYHTEQLVGFLCDKENSESIWGVLFRPDDTSVNRIGYPVANFVTGIIDERRCRGNCFLSGSLKENFLSLDAKNAKVNTYWSIIDHADGTVLIAFLEPENSAVYDRFINVRYLRANTRTQKVSFVLNKDEATIWHVTNKTK